MENLVVTQGPWSVTITPGLWFEVTPAGTKDDQEFTTVTVLVGVVCSCLFVCFSLSFSNSRRWNWCNHHTTHLEHGDGFSFSSSRVPLCRCSLFKTSAPNQTVMMLSFNTSIQEAEADGSPWVRGQARLQITFQPSQSCCTEKPCVEKLNQSFNSHPKFILNILSCWEWNLTDIFLQTQTPPRIL